MPGFLLCFSSIILCLLSRAANRAFTPSNSEIVTLFGISCVLECQGSGQIVFVVVAAVVSHFSRMGHVVSRWRAC